MYYLINIKKPSKEKDSGDWEKYLKEKFKDVLVVDGAEYMREVEAKQDALAGKILKIRVCLDYTRLFGATNVFSEYVEKFKKKYNIPDLKIEDDFPPDISIGLDYKVETNSMWLNFQNEDVQKSINADLLKFVEQFDLSYFFMAWLRNRIFYGEGNNIKSNIDVVSGMIENLSTTDPMGLTTVEKQFLIDNRKQELLQSSGDGRLSAEQKDELKKYKNKIGSIKSPKSPGFKMLDDLLELLEHGEVVEFNEVDAGVTEKPYKLTHRDIVSRKTEDKKQLDREVVNSRKRKQRFKEKINKIEKKISILTSNL